MSVQADKGVQPKIAGSEGLTRDSSLPPYHLFEKFGERFVFALTPAAFFHVDEPTYRLLDLCLTMSLEDAKRQLGATAEYAPELLDGIGQEIETLAKHGLFEVPNYNLDEAEIERQLDERYSVPLTKIELALAETCNLACKYCYCETSRDTPRQGLMTEDVARKAIDWLFAASKDAKHLGLTLFGGEPLLNKPVFRFVMEYSDALAKKHGKKIRYNMTTNATLLDDMVIDYIKKHNFGLMVSLDGPPNIHNAQRPFHDGSGSFEAAATGIKKLMRRRKSVTVRCTLTRLSPPLLDLIRFFDEFGFSRIVLTPAATPRGGREFGIRRLNRSQTPAGGRGTRDSVASRVFSSG